MYALLILCSHERADTRVLYLPKILHRQNHNKILIRTLDTDVVSPVSCFNRLQIEQLWKGFVTSLLNSEVYNAFILIWSQKIHRLWQTVSNSSWKDKISASDKWSVWNNWQMHFSKLLKIQMKWQYHKQLKVVERLVTVRIILRQNYLSIMPATFYKCKNGSHCSDD